MEVGSGQPGRNGPVEARAGESLGRECSGHRTSGDILSEAVSDTCMWQVSKVGLVRNLSCMEEETGSRQLPEGVVGWFISLLGPP